MPNTVFIELVIFASLLSAVCNSVLCASLANEKGYASGSAYFTGFFFGLFGLIYYSGLPDLNLRKCIQKRVLPTVEASAESADDYSEYGNR